MKFQYPLRDGHSLELLIDGAEFFSTMERAIDEARTSVLLVIYQMLPGRCTGRWCRALAAAAQRGLTVAVLADSFGGFPARAELAALRKSGVDVTWFNPPRLWPPLSNLFRDHRKLLLIDGTTGYIGGYCLSDSFDPACTDEPWHDIAIQTRGPCVADMLAEFRRDRDLYAGPGATVSAGTNETPGTARCRLVRNHPFGRREIRRSAHAKMRQARARIWWVTPYFAPTRRMRRELRRAARRGVDTRLLLSGVKTDHQTVRAAGMRHYGRLLRAGVRVFEYDERCLHMKALLCDDWLSAGSCNFDHWGMRWNRDANLETDSDDAVTALATLLAEDFDVSREVTLADYLERPWWQRLRQQVASLIDLWLVRAAYRRQLRASRPHPAAASRE